MPTLWSKSLIPTSRHVPAEATVPSHQLMLRAGLIRQLGAGTYDYLPLGWRSLMKAIAIVREEMDKAGAVEVFLPTLHPIELWEQTGRREAYGDNLFVIKDRHGREMALGPTHEEVMTELAKGFIESYRQTPITLYQIQTKFRDEYRPRFGVLRSREFQMKDAYSFDISREGLDQSYQKMYDAYIAIFKRCGIPIRIVEAESGPIGGSASHEFMVPSPTGEDMILESDKGNYAANVEKCETGTRSFDLEGAPLGELERIHTPGVTTVEEVGKFLKTKPKNILKTLAYKLKGCRDEGEVETLAIVLAVVRGDHEVNEGKLRKKVFELFSQPDFYVSKLVSFELLAGEDFRRYHIPVGYVGPHFNSTLLEENEDPAVPTLDVQIFADYDAAQPGFWVAGANTENHHAKYFNWKREVRDTAGFKYAVNVADIRNAVEGDPSPLNDGGTLRATKGIEIGHVFKLGTKYSDAMDFKIVDEKNERQPAIMGCYGIGVNRILAAAIERMDGDMKGHDENGIIWPAAIAPYQVLITPIKYEGQQKEVADALAEKLSQEKSPVGPLSFFHPDVLIDDRDERPGVKFKDADLIGIPVRITIGDKALAENKVEIKARTAPPGAKAELVPIEDAVKHVLELLAKM
ncbi:MAG: proline--tRNA ligase [Phycisphaeraceae bacterium]